MEAAKPGDKLPDFPPFPEFPESTKIDSQESSWRLRIANLIKAIRTKL
jgi:hypothetical protein